MVPINTDGKSALLDLRLLQWFFKAVTIQSFCTLSMDQDFFDIVNRSGHMAIVI